MQGHEGSHHNPATLALWVHQELRKAIVEGEIRPNTRLVETDLAKRLQISRTPVREGLQRLSADGLVISRRGGWVVREHTVTEVREIYETRAALEGYAARLAAERAGPQLLDEIAASHGAEGRRLMRISREELVRVNNSFHDAIARGSGNRRLIDLIQHNREFYFNYRIAELYNDEEVHASVKGHEAIMGALWDHDGDRAEEITRRHILEGLPIILSRLRLPDGDESGALGFSVASPWQVRQGAP